MIDKTHKNSSEPTNEMSNRTEAYVAGIVYNILGNIGLYTGGAMTAAGLLAPDDGMKTGGVALIIAGSVLQYLGDLVTNSAIGRDVRDASPLEQIVQKTSDL